MTLIFNNFAYGNVKRAQIQKYGGRVIASDLHNPDFVKLAESYGAQGLRAETPEALASAIRRGFDHDGGPTLIEIPVGDMPSPWHLIEHAASAESQPLGFGFKCFTAPSATYIA